MPFVVSRIGDAVIACADAHGRTIASFGDIYQVRCGDVNPERDRLAITLSNGDEKATFHFAFEDSPDILRLRLDPLSSDLELVEYLYAGMQRMLEVIDADEITYYLGVFEGNVDEKWMKFFTPLVIIAVVGEDEYDASVDLEQGARLHIEHATLGE